MSSLPHHLRSWRGRPAPGRRWKVEAKRRAHLLLPETASIKPKTKGRFHVALPRLSAGIILQHRSPSLAEHVKASPDSNRLRRFAIHKPTRQQPQQLSHEMSRQQKQSCRASTYRGSSSPPPCQAPEPHEIPSRLKTHRHHYHAAESTTKHQVFAAARRHVHLVITRHHRPLPLR